MRIPVTQLGQPSRGDVGRRAILLSLVLLSAAVFAPSAHAAALVVPVSASHTEVFPVEGYFCLPDAIGTATLTETSTGQFVETGSGVFAFHGVDEFELHIDFTDGSYVRSGLNRDVVSFVFNPRGRTVSTVAIQDLETIYDAQGQAVGEIAIHAGFHVTYTDLNLNGQPDDGEAKVLFDRFRLRCA